MNKKIHLISAFSKNHEGGNPAGVLLGSDGLTETQMKAIAKEVNFSETAFIEQLDDGFSLRFFTPEEEVDLCGHASVASFYLLREQGLFKEESHFTCPAGRIGVREEGDSIFIEQTSPVFPKKTVDPLRLKTIFSLDKAPEGSAVVSTGLEDIIMPVESVSVLKNMKVDLHELKVYSKELEVVGVHAFAEEGGSIFVRNFAPAVGIDEESATGTANAALAAYLYNRDQVQGEAQFSFKQGQWMNSPSLIRVMMSAQEIFVGGEAYFMDPAEKEVLL